MPQCEALGSQLFFYCGAENPCLEGCKPTLRLERNEAIQSLERKAENRPLRLRHFEVSDDAGSAAERYDQRVLIDTIPENLSDFIGGRRKSDTIRESLQSTPTQANPVRQTLPMGMVEPTFRVE